VGGASGRNLTAHPGEKRLPKTAGRRSESSRGHGDLFVPAIGPDEREMHVRGPPGDGPLSVPERYLGLRKPWNTAFADPFASCTPATRPPPTSPE